MFGGVSRLLSAGAWRPAATSSPSEAEPAALVCDGVWVGSGSGSDSSSKKQLAAEGRSSLQSPLPNPQQQGAGRREGRYTGIDLIRGGESGGVSLSGQTASVVERGSAHGGVADVAEQMVTVMVEDEAESEVVCFRKKVLLVDVSPDPSDDEDEMDEDGGWVLSPDQPKLASLAANGGGGGGGAAQLSGEIACSA